MAFNGDEQKKEIPGRKEGKEIKAEEDQDEQRDTDALTLMLSDGFMCVCVKVSVCVQTHVNTHKAQPSEMSNVRFR